MDEIINEEISAEFVPFTVFLRLPATPLEEITVNEGDNISNVLANSDSDAGDHGWTILLNGEPSSRSHRDLKQGDIIILSKKVKGN